MGKIVDKIKNKENICMLVLIILSLIGTSLNVYLTNNDELWVFQNIYKMYNGFQIYIDANVVCTPLFFLLGNILFHILGANFFVLRIYNIIIFTFYYFITYKIVRTLGIEKKFSMCCTLILIMFGSYMLPRVMANYNSLAMGLCLFGIYLMLKNKCVINSKSVLIQSIVCFLIILTKQNIGAYYFIALSIIILLSKKEDKVKLFIEEIIILGILGCVFIFGLHLMGLLEGFINYAVIGINQFATNNISVSWLNIFVVASILLLDLIVTIVLVKKGKNLIGQQQRETLIVLSCFSILLALTIYPIVNIVHCYFAIYVAIIEFIYIVNIILQKSEIKVKNKDKVLKIVLAAIILVDVNVNIFCIITWCENVLFANKYEYSEPFFGVIVSDELEEEIKNVTNFIREEKKEGKNVIIFSSKAALYMVPLKQSNGFYDLPLNGNFGNLSENDIFNDLKSKDNTLVLISKEEDSNISWQENKNIKEKIKSEFNYIGEIEKFEIYSL